MAGAAVAAGDGSVRVGVVAEVTGGASFAVVVFTGAGSVRDGPAVGGPVDGETAAGAGPGESPEHADETTRSTQAAPQIRAKRPIFGR